MQLDKNVFPRPVLPVKSKFFSFKSSKLLIKFRDICLIISIFSLGDLSEPNFTLSTIDE